MGRRTISTDGHAAGVGDPEPAAFRAEKQQFPMALYGPDPGTGNDEAGIQGNHRSAVNDVYCPILIQPEGCEPTLVDFLAALEKIDIPRSKMALISECSSPETRNIFAHKTNVDINSRIIAFGIRDIGKTPSIA